MSDGAGQAALPAAPALPRLSRWRFPLAVKLAMALVGLVTLVLVVNGTLDLWLSYEDAKRSAVEVQQEKAQAAAERVGAFLSDIEGQIGWTTRAEWRRVPTEQQRYDLIRLLRQAPAITEASYIDPSGREQLKVSRLEPDVVGNGRDLSADPRFARAVAEKVWFGPVYFRRGSEPYISIAVAHAGRNPGVTAAEVNLKLVWDVITSIRVGETGSAFVVTAAGRLIAHPDLSLVLRDTDLSGLPQVARALAPPGPAAAGGQPNAAGARTLTSEIVTDLSGRSVLSAHATIGRVGWLVFVQSPLTEALAPVYRSLVQIAVLLGLGLLLAAVAGTILARRMVVPIRRLQEGAERLGEGDLSQRIAIRTGDEIETLAERFNTMATRVQESHETLEHRVEARTRDLQLSLDELRKAQDRLVQSEKLAALGQLTAGIAHEIKNPLNFVNNFAALSTDLVAELREVLEPEPLSEGARGDVAEIGTMLSANLEKIVQHGRRADSIVRNMLSHSREGSGEHRLVDVNALVEESLGLAYQGARAERPDLGIRLATSLDPAAGQADLFAQEISRVLLNLFSNAIYAVSARTVWPDGVPEPAIDVATRDLGDRVEIRIRDNGTGIPEEIRAKIFSPFFTTKPTGEGTGLGLSLSHDIVVRQHGGSLDVASNPGEFTEFTIVLPRGSAAGAGKTAP